MMGIRPVRQQLIRRFWNVEKAGIEWLHNCLRHSFYSHAVALHGFTWTSLQADHSERMLRDQYREVVTEFEAEAYLAICA
jgi:hypothetical protein